MKNALEYYNRSITRSAINSISSWFDSNSLSSRPWHTFNSPLNIESSLRSLKENTVSTWHYTKGRFHTQLKAPAFQVCLHEPFDRGHS